jgi:phenylacetate-CoA ligase
LVRYRVGDRLRLADPAERCPCGRSLPMVLSVEGRRDDMLYTSNGRVVGRVDPVLKMLPLLESQIIQDSLDRVRVRYVPAPGFSAAAAAILTRRLRERMGDVDVVLEAVESIPRGAGGKFRLIVCNLPHAQRLALETNGHDALR